ncbi:GMC family oxidoreductase [Paracraurococcus lichenis]|uniref:GMC family oxidoreductase n=1 Tax=Paracraurococcus lichenis TaxID=3064888 RepID=A0ABT9DYW1_9PROT|nr:GMC family oxidoreductase [Paracraurococcus sp. LOR1-02]MDO9709071.1 GMC family oxidoreductase [Paracraurococcus sp. LOR1-02]
MARTLPKVDVVFVGFGFTASIIARELKDSPVRMLALERGRPRDTVPDFQSPAMHDELAYGVRLGLMQDLAKETVTVRNRADQVALPMRQLGSFLPGSDQGGAGVHWNGQTFRFQEADFRLRSHHETRYGKGFVPAELSIRDWGITYQDLEPHYDRFEHLCGISGFAGNVKGEIRPGGNPHEAPRSRDYPNPPTRPAYLGAIFAKAAMELGYNPYQVPSANMTQGYTNPEGVRLEPCMVCGYCERFGCEHFAKSSPQTTLWPVLKQQKNFSLRTGAHVTRVNLSKDRKHATGVTYVDAATGEELVQPAELVVLSAWAFHNARLMLLSGIGTPYDPRTRRGNVGRNYAYQTMSAVSLFYDEDVNLNQFMGAGALGTVIDDFSGDNYDHTGLGFLGGAYICAYTTGARPIEFHPVPPGTPRWGAGWKKAVAKHYNHTGGLQCHGQSNAAHANHVDLDPTYRDAYGQPLLRITFDFPQNDLRMSRYVTDRATEIAQRMGAQQIVAEPRTAPWSVVPYQTTHNTGGAIMGTNPKETACNRYGQSWDVPNVFVTGTALFPQNATYNPTDTVGALAYWEAAAIRDRYLRRPGALVHA